MRRALEYVRAFDGVIAQHAQDPQLAAVSACCHGVRSPEAVPDGRPRPRRAWLLEMCRSPNSPDPAARLPCVLRRDRST